MSVLVGANFDDTITYPPFFRDHILPWLEEAASLLHAKGKLLLCHTDGENKGLMDFLRESGMDIADFRLPGTDDQSQPGGVLLPVVSGGSRF